MISLAKVLTQVGRRWCSKSSYASADNSCGK